MLTRRLSLFALALPHCLAPQRRVFTADSDAARGEEKPARGGNRVGEERGRCCLRGASQTARQPQTSQQCRPVHRWWTAGKREAFDTVTLISTPQQTAAALAVVSSVASHGLLGFDCRGDSARDAISPALSSAMLAPIGSIDVHFSASSQRQGQTTEGYTHSWHRGQAPRKSVCRATDRDRRKGILGLRTREVTKRREKGALPRPGRQRRLVPSRSTARVRWQTGCCGCRSCQ